MFDDNATAIGIYRTLQGTGLTAYGQRPGQWNDFRREPDGWAAYDAFGVTWRISEDEAAMIYARLERQEMITDPGVFAVTATEYHSDMMTPEPAMSCTIGKLGVNQSPLHAWTASPRLNPAWVPTVRKTFDIGKGAHRGALGKGEEVAEIPGELLSTSGAVGTKAAKEWVEQARARGLVPLVSAEIEQLRRMRDKLFEVLGEVGISFDPDDSERAAYAVIDGVWCRCMADNAPADPREPLTDFKTCEDASLDACIRAISSYDYAFQAAHYRATWHAATGERRRFRFIFQEKSPPYEVGIVTLAASGAGDWYETADDKVREARRIWRHGLDTGHWPGYPRVEAEVGAPGWYVQRWEERQRPSLEAIRRSTEWQAPRSTA